MEEYTCFVCRKKFESEEPLPETNEDEVLLCEDCAETVYRLTGIKGGKGE